MLSPLEVVSLVGSGVDRGSYWHDAMSVSVDSPSCVSEHVNLVQVVFLGVCGVLPNLL